MKKILSIIAVAACAAFSSITASAQEEITFLVVNLQDGGMDKYKLPDEPTVKIENHKLTVTAPTMECEYDFDKVSHFSFSKEIVTGVDQITDEGASFSFTFVDNATVIISAPELEWAAAYNVNGLEVARAKADANVVTLDVSTFAPGVYVIAPSCHEAVKIIKR